MKQHLKEQTTAIDRNRRAHYLHERLLDTMKSLVWTEADYNRQLNSLEAIGQAPREFSKEAKKTRRRGWSASKDYERLSGCQTQWVGYRAKCCASRSVAVPIGCNHRLCPLCNNHRAERYRTRVQALFHTLGNPQLLTLTVPSPRIMSRKVLDTLRTRLKAFLKQQSSLLKGGVYSIEVTYNSVSKTWHPHVHVLVDVHDKRTRLPYAEFRLRKLYLEFAWLVLTQGRNNRWKSSDFNVWYTSVLQRIDGFTAGSGGCGQNRRVIDLRNVTKDKKAAYEVLKYMSKASSFIGDPAALKQLLVAIRGVRQIQTFGKCYRFKIEHPAPTAHMECECGKNEFETIGYLGLGMVKLSPEGIWYIRDDAPGHERHRCRGSST